MSTKIGIDVRSCAGSGYQMQFTNDFINPWASFDNMVGVYFEREDESIIEDAIVIYPRTKNQDLSDFFEFIPVPHDAVWMGYWLLSNARASWTNCPDYQKFDTLWIRKSEDGFTRCYQNHETTGFYDNGYQWTRPVGKQLSTSGYAGQVHLSNPANNYGNYEWFMVEEDGSILIEDMQLGSGWDFGVWWSKPRSIVPCDCF